MITSLRKPWSIVAAVVCLFSIAACNKSDFMTEEAPADSALRVNAASAAEHKSAYAIGASVGTYIANMKKTQAEYIGEIDDAYIIQGFTDALRGTPQIDDKEIETTLSRLDERVQQQMQDKAQAQAQANLEAGRRFLASNAAQEGVVTTGSGLQYKVNKEGSGAKPRLNDTISVKYRGTTLDGKVFDEQQEAVDFPLNNQMIKGWVEGIQLMSKGASYTLYIPAELAYGEDGAGDRIRPNSLLIFDVELIDFKAPASR